LLLPNKILVYGLSFASPANPKEPPPLGDMTTPAAVVPAPTDDNSAFRGDNWPARWGTEPAPPSRLLARDEEDAPVDATGSGLL
jgi:hypothetical protein